MDASIRRAIAKIEVVQPDGRSHRGTGTLVSPRLVLTALHVVAGRDGTPHTGEIRLSFPEHSTQARLYRDFFDPEQDWALLECTEPPLQTRPVRLVDTVRSGREFETFGFPDTQPVDGIVQTGRVEDHNARLRGAPTIQLFSEQAAAGDGAPVKGASGSPVLVDRALVGVLRFALMTPEQATRAGTLYACSARGVLERCAHLLPRRDDPTGDAASPPFGRFDHHVFVSYASVDNIPDHEGERGWVDELCRQLPVRLLKLFGEPADVWWDRERDARGRASTRAEEAAARSAVIVPLLSNAYRNAAADGLVPELEWFHQQFGGRPASRHSDEPRVLPVLMYNLPVRQWPDECTRSPAAAFHDAEADDRPGAPLKPRSDAYEGALTQLVERVYRSLRALEPVAEPSETAPAPAAPVETAPALDPPVSPAAPTEAAPFTIFLGCPTDDLRTTHRQLREALELSGTRVLESIPPPFCASEHTQAVTDALRVADLAVHLLGSSPGEPVDGGAGETYPVEQSRLALDQASSQLILMPPELDISLVEEDAYARYLTSLRDRIRNGTSLEVMRVDRHRMLHEILAKQDRLREAARRETQSALPDDVFLDVHSDDLPYAADLVAYLFSKRIHAITVPAADLSPKEQDSKFEDQLKRAGLFIVVFGSVARDWVESRLEQAFKFITSRRLSSRLAVYVTPPVKTRGEIQFPCPVVVNTGRFTPELVEPLLSEPS